MQQLESIMTIKQLTATQLQQKLQHQDDLFLLDVREENEYAFTHIADSILIPLNTIPARIAELNPEQEIVVICHHGRRSQAAADFLEQQGFKNLMNLIGGVEAWASECDKTMPRY